MEKIYVVYHHYSTQSIVGVGSDDCRQPICAFASEEQAEKFVKDHENPVTVPNGFESHYDGLNSFGALEIEEVGFGKPLGDLKETFWWLFRQPDFMAPDYGEEDDKDGGE